MALLVGVIELVAVLCKDTSWVSAPTGWAGEINVDNFGSAIVGIFIVISAPPGHTTKEPS